MQKYLLLLLPLFLHAHLTEAFIMVGFIYVIVFVFGVLFLRWFYKALRAWFKQF